VAIGIIDLLEEINIGHDDGEGAFISFKAGTLILDTAYHLSSV
jgi:hypothetical protein